MITKPIELNTSEIKRYATCPLQWAYSKSIKPGFVTSSLAFGKAFRKAASYYAQACMAGRKPSVEPLLCVFGHTLEAETHEIRYKKNETFLTMIDEAEALFHLLIDEAPSGKIIRTDQAFTCKIDDALPAITGTIEMIQERDGGKILVDWKTCSRRPASVQFDKLMLHGIAVERMGLVEPGRYSLECHAFVRTKTPQHHVFRYTPTAQSKKRVLETARRCFRGMRGNTVYPNEGWQCASCGYQSHCKSWPVTNDVTKVAEAA